VVSCVGAKYNVEKLAEQCVKFACRFAAHGNAQAAPEVVGTLREMERADARY